MKIIPDKKQRLTARTRENLAYLVNVRQKEQELVCKYKNTLQCVYDAIQRLAEYEEAEEQKRIIVFEKETYQPLFVKCDAVNTFDKWNETTGAIPNGTSWHYEAQAVIEEIAAMAFGAGIMYHAETQER